MAKKTTRRTAKSADKAPAPEPKSVTSTASTEKNGGSAKPKVKKMAAPKRETPPAPKQRAMKVELLEGASYSIKGVTFLKDRPVVVTDERILAELEVNSRFKVESA